MAIAQCAIAIFYVLINMWYSKGGVCGDIVVSVLGYEKKFV